MTSYQATIHASQHRRGTGLTLDRATLSRAASVAVAVVLALLVLVVSIELTMGYGLDRPDQPVARPVPGLGL